MFTLVPAQSTPPICRRASALAAALLVAGLAPAPSWAANAAFQSFFDTAFTGICASQPTSAICGLGSNLSGDSEDSLNPSQPLAYNDIPSSLARQAVEDAESRALALLDGKSPTWDAGARMGPFSLLVHGRYDWFDRQARGIERGYDGTGYGLELGTDRRLGEGAVAGALLSYHRTEAEFDADGAGVNFVPQASEGSTDSDSLTLTVFGAMNLGESGYLEGSLGYGVSDLSLRRNVLFQNSTRTTLLPVNTRADTDGREYWASIGAGWDMPYGAASWGPYARLTYTHSEIDGYTETETTGLGLGMTVADSDRKSLTAALGVRASHALSREWGVLVPHVRLEYEHEFKDDPAGITTAFTLDGAGTGFSLAGATPDQDWFNLAAGVQFILANGLIPFIEFETLLGHRDLDRYRLLVGLRSEF